MEVVCVELQVGQVKANVTASPLLKLATFQVDLLVNSKVTVAMSSEKMYS